MNSTNAKFCYLPYALTDLNAAPVKEEFMSIAVRVGDTYHIMKLPKSETINIVYDFDK